MSQSRVWDNLNMPHQAGGVKEEETVCVVYLGNPVSSSTVENGVVSTCTTEVKQKNTRWVWDDYLPNPHTYHSQNKPQNPHPTSAPGSSVVLTRPEPDKTKARAHVTCTWRWAGAVKLSLICTSASKLRCTGGVGYTSPQAPPNSPRCSLLVCYPFQGFWCISKVQIGEAKGRHSKMFMSRTSKFTAYRIIANFWLMSRDMLCIHWCEI